MPSDSYPAGTVRALLDTDLVTPVTRAVLLERLQSTDPPYPRFLTPTEFATLASALARLFADPEAPTARSLAFAIDERLASGKSDGWRYDSMPPDGEAARLGLRGLDEAALVLSGSAFVEAEAVRQEEVLRAIQGGDPPGEVWQTLPAARFFEELLAEASECYYSHPLAQEEIGYVGMADGRGWRRIGLGEREAWEPEVGIPPAPNSGGVGVRPKPETTGAVGEEGAASSAPTRRAQGGRFAVSETVDAVVIGLGAGGSPLLARLAQAGLKVVALEAGPFWNPARDFATDERAQTKLFWNDERLSAGGDPLAFRGEQLGHGRGRLDSALHCLHAPRPP